MNPLQLLEQLERGELLTDEEREALLAALQSEMDTLKNKDQEAYVRIMKETAALLRGIATDLKEATSRS